MVSLVAHKPGKRRAGTVLRSAAFNLLYGLWTVVMHVICLPLLLGPRRWTYAAARIWIDVTLWLLKRVVGLDCRVIGTENLPQGPAIFASKHQSAWETLFLSRYLGFPAFILKKELLAIPLFGWFIRKAGMIAINRSAGAGALRQMGRQAAAVFEQGRAVLIFPEGTRVPPGQKRPYHPGIAGLYSQLKVPVIPVALNSGLYWGRRAFVKRPGTITVEILPPIRPGLDRKVMMHELEARIETASNALARVAETGRRKQR
jgi:1-acyl-sn-glycerol-3-phosphate acyltransferase